MKSSNITSLSKFPVGSQFPVRVNITNAGPIGGFDVSIRYNITFGRNVLQAVRTGAELSGGLFDPDRPPAGCSVFALRTDVDIPPGLVRFAVVFVGGCSVNGTGTLFTILFQVTGIGATSIEIIRTNASGMKVSKVASAGTEIADVPFQPVDAYFRNKPGMPPVVNFFHLPFNPVVNDTVHFDASQSYDPENSTSTDKGVRRFLWTFGDNSLIQSGGVQTSHVFIIAIHVPAYGNFTVRLVEWDFDDDIPAAKVVVVNVASGPPRLVSLNWSGYAVAGPLGSVTNVRGSWAVPAIVGACPPLDMHSSFWVGIDGLNSQTVEQAGTESACINGVPTYFAWYEFFPRPSVQVRAMSVHPGDIISAEVSFSNGKFTVSLSDLTSGSFFTRTAVIKSAELSSGEWIAEAPSSRSGILPLANFGTIGFGEYYTRAGGTNTATVGGQTGAMGLFGFSLASITMVDLNGFVKAQPSGLTSDQTSFSVQWRNS